MSNPGKHNDKEMLDRLRFERLVDDTALDQDAQEQLAGDPELKQELLLNKALRLGKTEAPEMPRSLVDDALRRAQELKPGSQTRPHTARFSWQLAAAVAMGVAVIAVVALFQLPLKLTRTDDGGIQVGVESAWATGNGYVLDYTIAFDDAYTGTSQDSPDHPLWRIYRLLADWSAEHPESGTPDGRPAASLEISDGKLNYGGDTAYLYSLYIKVFSADQEQINGLVDELAAITELSEPEVDAEYWYFNEQVPDTYFTGRTVVINGHSYEYPVEMNTAGLEMIEMLLHFSGEQGQMYLALDDIEEYRRYDLGDVVKVSWPDAQTVSLETQPFELEFASLGLPSWYHFVSVYVPAAEVDIDFDPLRLITTYAQSMAKALKSGGGGGSPRGFSDMVVVPLAPEEDWLETTPGELAVAITDAEIQDRLDTAAALGQLIDGLIQQYPDASGQIRGQVVNLAGVPTHWVGHLHLEFGDHVLIQLVEAVREAGHAEYRVLTNLPGSIHARQAAQRSQDDVHAYKAVAIWMFLPQVRWLAIPRANHNLDPFNPPTAEEQARAEEEWVAALQQEFSIEEIETARAQSEVVNTVFNDWVADNPVLGEKFDANPAPVEMSAKARLINNVAGEVRMSVFVKVTDLDEAVAQAWIDELIALVEATGTVTTQPSTRMELTTYFPPEG